MSGGFVRLVAVEAVDEGGICSVRLDGLEPIAVYRVGERFYATQDTCTHAQAALSAGWLEGFEVFCPVHDARFDIRDGRPLCFPATQPLRVFAVIVKDGAVWADIGTARRI